MKRRNIPVAKLKPHPDNPRTISKEKFELLKTSITEFPEMLRARPLVVSEEGFVLGGNMRLKAMQDLKIKVAPCMVVNWSRDQENEFVIKDNASFGQWDFDRLANEWDADVLQDWGLDVWTQPEEPEDELEDALEDGAGEGFADEVTLKLIFSKSEYDQVVDALNAMGGTREQAVISLIEKQNQ